MASKTLYVAVADLPLWAEAALRAQDLGLSLSEYVTLALRKALRGDEHG